MTEALADPVFTTKGFLPREELEFRESQTEDPRATYIRTDKHLRATGEWVGNDLHIILKEGSVTELAQESLV